MRADRILSILLLQNEGKLTTRQLASRLEVSERTILRDMEALSMAGIPVYSERGSQGGWRLTEGYRTNLTGMKPEELQALIISAHPDLLSDLGMGAHYQVALQKLLASSSGAQLNAEQVRQKIHIDGAGWHQARETCPFLHVVQEAVWAERKLRMHYKREGEVSVRVAEPLGLVAKRSVWYLVAAGGGEIKTYRISRITEAEVLDESFVRPDNFVLAQYWEASTAAFRQQIPRLIVRVRTDRLYRLEQDRYVTVLSSEESGDGWAAVHIEFADIEHAGQIILGLGSAAEALLPEELRSRVTEELLGAVGNYEEIRNRS